MSWAACLPNDLSSSCARLRLFERVEAGVSDGWMWLRAVGDLSEELRAELCKVPGLDLFEVTPEATLIPDGASVPRRVLPNVDWQPIAQVFEVVLPGTRPPARSVQAAAVRLERSSHERPAAGMWVDFDEYARWAETATSARLRGLAFARSAEGVAFVRGDPLPPLAGLAYWIDGLVAVPCGFEWWPRVDAAVIARSLSRAVDAPLGEHIFLFEPSGAWHAVPVVAFVQSNRAAVRAPAHKDLP